MIVQPVVEPTDRFAALLFILNFLNTIPGHEAEQWSAAPPPPGGQGFLCVIKPDTMDQPHVWLKNYQNVNLDLIWVDKLHNFTLKLREHWSTHRSLLSQSHTFTHAAAGNSDEALHSHLGLNRTAGKSELIKTIRISLLNIHLSLQSVPQ